MSNISTEGIETSVTQLKNITANIQDKFNQLTEDLAKINSSIDTLMGYNGQDASELYREKYQSTLKNIFIRPICYKYIWQIQIQNNPGSNISSNSYIKSFAENIEYLKLGLNELEQVNTEIERAIHEIELQLGVSYTGNIVTFFNGLKGNPGWEEIKEKAAAADLKKETDALYQMFRSKNKEKDVVDIALDEMGTTFLATTLSSKYALWYFENYPSSGATPQDDWCAEYVSYIMNKSGNADSVNPYLNVVSGANNAKAKAANGEGIWHSSSDTSYEPKRGDIFYTYEGAHQHTGIVLGSNGNEVYTIEGNTAQDDGVYYVSTNSNKGGCVNTRIRDKSYIEGGYYTPAYKANPIIPESSSNKIISQEAQNLKLGIDGRYEEHRKNTNNVAREGMG